ncbi:DsbA family protein [Actinomycetota bacterium]
MGANAKKRREAAATSGSMSRQDKINAAAPKGGSGGPNKILLATIAAIVAIAAIVGAVILGSQGEKADTAAGGSDLPAGVSAMGAGLNANKDVTLVDKAPTLDIYEDFQCPACAQAEQLVGPTVKKLAADGKIKLNYHVMNFLDRNLGNDSSTRAAAAAFCSADAGKFQEFHDAVFANQPAKEGDGWDAATLKKFATDAGVDGAAYDTCVKSNKHKAYLESVQTQTTKDGVTSTPTFKLNGEKMNLAGLTADTFTKAVEDATK